MKKKNLPLKTPSQGDWSETEMLAANLLQAHLFGLPKQEQKRIMESLVPSQDESAADEVDIARLIPLLNKIVSLSLAEMDVWLTDTTLSVSFRRSICEAKNALREENFASLENSPNAYLTKVLKDLYKIVEQ